MVCGRDLEAVKAGQLAEVGQVAAVYSVPGLDVRVAVTRVVQDHLHRLQLQVRVDLLNGPLTSFVTMRTTMLNATGMEVLVVIMMKQDGITFVQLVNVLTPMLVQLVKTYGRPKNA